jgi:hypothetical protein
MGLLRTAVLGVVLMAGVSSGALRAAEPALLTGDEVKKLVDSGAYKDALKALLRVLDLKGAAAANYDRHEMLMLKVECQLQLKDQPGAKVTLETARKEAVEAKKDGNVAAAAALATLLEKSSAWNYTPKTGAVKKPIPILDRTLRKAAFDALFADEFTPLENKVKAAANAKSLGPIVEAARLAGAIRAVERVSTGENKKTEAIVDALTKQSLKLLDDAVTDMAAKTQKIHDSANRVVTETVNMTDSQGRQYQTLQSRRKGITNQERDALKGIKTEAAKIPTAAGELAAFLGSDAAPFTAIGKKAETVKDTAEKTLTDDYVNVLRQ